MLWCGFMMDLNQFQPTAPTKVMLCPFSLPPLAEQSDLPCADSVAHSTATQAQRGGICAEKQPHSKRQNDSFPLD